MRGLLLGVVTCVSDVLLVLWPQDRSENEVEKVKGTLILCYGHVAARAPRELVLARAESDILRNIFQCFSTKVGAWAALGGRWASTTHRNTSYFLLFRFWE